MNIYAKNILDHYQRPHNFGPLEDAPLHQEINRSCGDTLTVYAEIQDSKLVRLSFTGHGCAISMAATSILSEALLGKDIQDILSLGLPDIQKLLGIEISLRREKCAMIGLRAVQNLIKEQ